MPTLAAVVNAVADGTTDVGLAPFYNTNFLSVYETQAEIIKRPKKVYVRNIFKLPVKHFLCGFGELENVTEIRSKSVVFHQVSEWLKAHRSGCEQKDCESTSAAVSSLLPTKAVHVAAIGTKSACKAYGVPVIAGNIQNRPNVTLFFELVKDEPNPVNCHYVLMCVPAATENDKQVVEDELAECNCGISANWRLHSKTMKPGKSEPYFFEINGQFQMLDLNTAVGRIKRKFKKSFLVGGYTGTKISDLVS